MKMYIYNFFVVCFMLLSCKADDDKIKLDIVGKWSHTYQIKEKDANGNWGKWVTINTLVKLPILEFTNDGRILWDGKESSTCCQYKKYEVKGTDLALSSPVNLPDCQLVDCADCSTWHSNINGNLLELEICNTAHRYEKL